MECTIGYSIYIRKIIYIEIKKLMGERKFLPFLFGIMKYYSYICKNKIINVINCLLPLLCTTPKSLPQPIIVPKLSPDQFWEQLPVWGCQCPSSITGQKIGPSSSMGQKIGPVKVREIGGQIKKEAL